MQGLCGRKNKGWRPTGVECGAFIDTRMRDRGRQGAAHGAKYEAVSQQARRGAFAAAKREIIYPMGRHSPWAEPSRRNSAGKVPHSAPANIAALPSPMFRLYFAGQALFPPGAFVPIVGSDSLLNRSLGVVFTQKRYPQHCGYLFLHKRCYSFFKFGINSTRKVHSSWYSIMWTAVIRLKSPTRANTAIMP